MRLAAFRSGRRLVAWALGALASIAAGATPAAAGEPAAIVEDVGDGVEQLAFMDYVEAGRVIDLGQDGRIVLGYLRSCLRETVVGGRLTVGREQSSIAGGRVDRVRVECDGGRMVTSVREAGKSTVMVLRQVPPGGPAVQPTAPPETDRV